MPTLNLTDIETWLRNTLKNFFNEQFTIQVITQPNNPQAHDFLITCTNNDYEYINRTGYPIKNSIGIIVHQMGLPSNMTYTVSFAK